MNYNAKELAYLVLIFWWKTHVYIVASASSRASVYTNINEFVLVAE